MLRAYLGEFTPSSEIEDADGLDMLGLDTLPQEQLAPHAPSAADIDEFSQALGVQEQAPVKFSSSPIQESSDTTSAIAGQRNYATQEVSRFQLLVAAVGALVNVTEDRLLTTLTENDHQGLVTALDKLIDVVGEDENHLFAPLMHFIGKLIEKYEETSNVTHQYESLDREEVENELPLPAQDLEAAYSDAEPEYTLDMLISVNPDYAGLNEEGTVSLRVPARGLEAAYGNDEPEYTLDMLTSANPEYDV
jgi:HTH-type transcriptional regulator/antitoxin HigA